MHSVAHACVYTHNDVIKMLRYVKNVVFKQLAYV